MNRTPANPYETVFGEVCQIYEACRIQAKQYAPVVAFENVNSKFGDFISIVDAPVDVELVFGRE